MFRVSAVLVFSSAEEGEEKSGQGGCGGWGCGGGDEDLPLSRRRGTLDNSKVTMVTLLTKG